MRIHCSSKWCGYSIRKSVRGLDQWDLRDLESLRPLVASLLRSECYSSGLVGFEIA